MFFHIILKLVTREHSKEPPNLKLSKMDRFMNMEPIEKSIWIFDLVGTSIFSHHDILIMGLIVKLIEKLFENFEKRLRIK
eukprot:UN16073